MSEKGEGDPAPAVSLPLCPASAAQGQADLGWVGAERAEQEWGGRRRGWERIPRQAGGRAPDICQGVGAAVCASEPDDKVHNSEERGHTRRRGN